MTKEEKIRAYSMLLDGCTLQEAADEVGVSKQRIAQLFPGANRRLDDAANSCIYPNISSWMIRNGLGYAAIARGCNTHTQTVRYALTGCKNIRKELIDKILLLTGMSYEEAFFQK